MAKTGRKSRVQAQPTRSVNVRFTADELDGLDQNALFAGLTRSDFVRRCVLGKRVVPKPGVLDLEAIHELKRLGNNLNQAVKRLHETHQDSPQLERVAAQVEEAIRKVLGS